MPDVSIEAPNPQQIPAAVAASASDKFHLELQKTVTVYGVTNRHLSNDGKSFEDGGTEEKRDADVHYYKESVPVAGKSGDFHATGTGQIDVIDKAEFDKDTKDAVQHAGNKLGIYLHGIRNAIGEPGEKAAEISADSGETFVVEDWASTKAIPTDSKWQNLINILKQEKADYASSAQSQGMINDSAEDLINRFGAQNIDLVGHSRGSLNEVRLLADLQAKGKAPVHSALFAHSDIDITDFAHSLPDFYKATQHVNVLYSPQDTALSLSAWQKTGQACLDDGCTITDSQRLGSVGLTDQYFQNQAKGLAGPGYFLSMQDVTNDKDENGHMMTSKKAADILTTPDIYASKANELKDGPTYKAIDPAVCKIALTEAPTDNKKTDGAANDASTTSPKKEVRIIDPPEVKQDFVSASPEINAARAKAATTGQHWLPVDNIWACTDTAPKKQ